MLRTAKATLASARHQGSRIASTLGSVPRPHIDTRLVKEALRSAKRGIERAADTVTRVVNRPGHVEHQEVGTDTPTDQPKTVRFTPEAKPIKPNEKLEKQFGFWVVSLLQDSPALATFRSHLATELPKLDQASQRFNEAVESRSTQQFKLLEETFLHLESIRDSTAVYANHAKTVLYFPTDATPDPRMVALDDMLSSINKQLAEIKTILKTHSKTGKSFDYDQSTLSETSESSLV